jgi:spore maturation protein CgeB/SAM-dependent methyltransferase
MNQPRILTFNFHEPYLCLMAKTGLHFDVGTYETGNLAREWQQHFRPKPDNLHLVPEKEWRQAALRGDYDVIIAHNEMNAAELLRAKAAKLLICHNRRSFILAGASADHGDTLSSFDRLMHRLMGVYEFVFISSSKQADYGLPGRVIPPGIDVEELGGYTGEKASVLRVGNAMSGRNLMFDVGLQQVICQGLPNRILGVNPDLAGSAPSTSYEELLEHYRQNRCMLHVSREEYEDGYNLAMLEAMACGMPVVALQNRTSPLTDREDGFLSHDAVVLRQRLEELLNDPDLARAMGERGRETVAEKFPIEAFAEKWTQAIFEAADGKSGGGPVPKPSKKPKVVLHYLSSPLTTGRYFDLAARPQWDILTTGYRLPEEVLSLWGFDESPPPYPPAALPLPLKSDYAMIREQLPLGYKGDLYFYVDFGAEKIDPDIELLDMPKIAYLVDVHVTTKLRLAMARHFDVVFLAQKVYVDFFREQGVKNVFWAPLACWPPMHAMASEMRHYDFSYVGGLSPEEEGRRRELMSGLQKRFPNNYVGRAYPADMAKIYNQSKIVVNACHNRDVNMRVFEALASGALLITDEADGLEDLFEDGKHLIIYRTDEEAGEKVQYYLAHPEEREAIAEAGREWVLAHHTYSHRIQAILKQTEAALGPLDQPGRHLQKQTEYYEQPRRELLPHIPFKTKRVLDIGCGAGGIGRMLREERDIEEVVGVEIEEEVYLKAKEVLDQAFLGSIEELELPFEDGHFDCIICADVLEHLVDPEKALAKLGRWLARDGVIVISVPNVRFHEVQAMLSSGAWRYADMGILDYTHLRWFTRSVLKRVIEAAGLEAAEIHPLNIASPGAVTRNKDGSVTLHKTTIKNLKENEFEDFLVFQFVGIACKPSGDRLAKAREALETGNFEAAFSLAVDAVGVDPGAQRRIIAKSLARMGQLEKADQYFQEALEYDDDPTLLGEYGTLLLGMNRGEEAKPYLEKALAALPEDPRIRGAMGLLHMAREELQEAYDDILFALRDGYDQLPLLGHGLALARALGRHEELLDIATGYADFYPGDLDLACECAAFLFDAGQHDQARQRLDTILLFAPTHERAQALLAQLNDQEG